MAGFVFKIGHIRLFCVRIGHYRSKSKNADYFGNSLPPPPTPTLPFAGSNISRYTLYVELHVYERTKTWQDSISDTAQWAPPRPPTR